MTSNALSGRAGLLETGSPSLSLLESCAAIETPPVCCAELEVALKGISIAVAVTLRYGACAGKKDMMATDFDRKDYAQSEGQVAKAIEEQTAKLPSDAFLWLAVGSMAVSATMQMMGKKHVSLFVAQWAPTLLIFGLYNKLVKQLGSDRSENAV